MPSAIAPQSDRRRAKAKSDRSWITGLRVAFGQAQDDNAGIVAAGVAFYSFLALVPLLGALVLLYGIVADPATIARHASDLTDMLPPAAAELIAGQLEGIVESSGGTAGLGLFIALGLALFSARGAMGALILALDIAYGIEDGRGFLKRNLLAYAMTLGMAVGILVAAGAVAATAILPGWGASIAGYAVVLGAAVIGAGVLYRFGPDRPAPAMRYQAPGAILFGVLATVLTLGFGLYVSNFADYNATYGALGAVVVLLMWLYLMGYAIVLGAELNAPAEFEAADNRQTS